MGCPFRAVKYNIMKTEGGAIAGLITNVNHHDIFISANDIITPFKKLSFQPSTRIKIFDFILLRSDKPAKKLLLSALKGQKPPASGYF